MTFMVHTNNKGINLGMNLEQVHKTIHCSESSSKKTVCSQKRRREKTLKSTRGLSLKKKDQQENLADDVYSFVMLYFLHSLFLVIKPHKIELSGDKKKTE
jgi:hypothetical protein